MNFLQNNPFFRLLLPYILGIILFRRFQLPNVFLFVFTAISVICVFVSFFLQKTRHYYSYRYLFGTGIFLLLFLFGYKAAENKEYKNAQFDFVKQKGIFQIELLSAPIEKANSYQCEVALQQYFDSLSWKKAEGKAIVYFQKDSAASALLYGDRLMVETVFNSPEAAQNPYGFDYAEYLKRQGIAATAYVAGERWRQIDRNTDFSVKRAADECRRYLLDIYRKFNISGQEFAVLAALTLGYTADLDQETRDSYSASGAMHVLAVSGLHVGIIYAVFMLLFAFLNKNRWQRLLKTFLAIVFLWIYAFIAGLSPSITRATLMFSFVAVGAALDRKSQTYNTIFMSAFLMLLINPNYLFEIGFQLSYSAVLSIILFTRLFSEKIVFKYKVLNWSCNLMLVSLAAQIATAPFTIYYFNQFPMYFLFTNLIVIPAASVIIYGAVLLLISSFLPIIPSIIAFVLTYFIRIINHCIDFIHRLPFSQYFVAIEESQIFLLFLAVFCFVGYFFSKKYLALAIGLVSVLLVFSISLFIKFQTLNSSKIIVYAGIKHSHISFIEAGKNLVYTDDMTELNRVANTFWLRQKIDKPQNIQTEKCYDNGFVHFRGNRFFIMTNDDLKGKTTANPLEIDYLIIGGSLKVRVDDLFECLHPKLVIVDKTITKWYCESIKNACKERNIAYYSIADEGAYVLSFTN